MVEYFKNWLPAWQGAKNRVCNKGNSSGVIQNVQKQDSTKKQTMAVVPRVFLVFRAAGNGKHFVGYLVMNAECDKL